MKKKGDEYKNMITFSGVLNCLDGLCFKEGLITIMTTNYPDKLDPALIRPGRIDDHLEFGYSTKEEIKMIYDKFYPDKNDTFESFYKKNRNLNLTMATLQEYFLEHMDGEKLLEDSNVLRKRANKFKYDDKAHDMYT